MCVKACIGRPWRSLHPPSTPIARKASQSPTVVLSPSTTPTSETTAIKREPPNRCSRPPRSYPNAKTTKNTRTYKPTIFSLPVELIIMICKQLDDVWSIWALQETCRHFKHLLTINEVSISKSMSRSQSLLVTIDSEPGNSRTLASIYPLETYGWPWDDRPSYYWLSLLQYRSKAFREIKSLNHHTQPHLHTARFLNRAWDTDVTHLLWSWCELPSDEAAFTFLNTLDPEVCAGVCEFYFTVVFTLTQLLLELPRLPSPSPSPPPSPSPSSPETVVIAPPIADVVRNVSTSTARLWDLLEESERALGPPIVGCVLVLESTAALLGPFLMRDWVGGVGFMVGASREPDTPTRWPSYGTMFAWLDTTAGECVRQTHECYNRTNQLFLFYGVQKHQKRSLIERCTAELGRLREKMAGTVESDVAPGI